jgi:hypothetical protein
MPALLVGIVISDKRLMRNKGSLLGFNLSSKDPISFEFITVGSIATSIQKSEIRPYWSPGRGFLY